MLRQDRAGNKIHHINSYNATLTYISNYQAVQSVWPETACVHKSLNHTWQEFCDGNSGGDEGGLEDVSDRFSDCFTFHSGVTFYFHRLYFSQPILFSRKRVFPHLMQCGFQSPPKLNTCGSDRRIIIRETIIIYLIIGCFLKSQGLYIWDNVFKTQVLCIVRKLIKKWNTSAVKLAWDAKTEEIREKCKCNGLDTILLFSSQKTHAHKREKVIFLPIPLFHTSPPF